MISPDPEDSEGPTISLSPEKLKLSQDVYKRSLAVRDPRKRLAPHPTSPCPPERTRVYDGPVFLSEIFYIRPNVDLGTHRTIFHASKRQHDSFILPTV